MKLSEVREVIRQVIAEAKAEGGLPKSAEYAHMQKYVNEYNKLKDAHAKLAEMLDGQITEIEGKIVSETQKVKELMGLIEKAPKAKKEKKDAKKADKKADKKEEPKEEKAAEKADDKK